MGQAQWFFQKSPKASAKPGFGECEAVDRGAVHGEQVAVVGLVVGISYLAELFSGEGVDDARVEGGGGEGALDEAVVAAGALDDDEEVAEVVIGDGLAKLPDGVVDGGAVVGEALGWDEKMAEEVGKDPFGIVFVAIEAGDAEVRGAGLLDPVVEVAAGLVERGGGASRAGSAIALAGHGRPPRTG
jgi:hypothetical protein